MSATISSTSPTRVLGLAMATTAFACGFVQAQHAEERSQVEKLVFGAFPEADAYSYIVRDVQQDDRTTIEQRLPFKVHFNEIGEHALLVAFRGRRPVGLIYRRTEEADWGLTEIAWHLTLDLKVLDFEFTRGRNRHMQEVARSPAARQLIGLDFAEVVDLIRRRDAQGSEQRDTDLEKLTTVVIRSAAKALVVTETVWRTEVEKLHDQATGFDLFPAAAQFTRRTTNFELDDGNRQQVVEVKVIYAYDVGNTLLGCVIWSRSKFANAVVPIRWVIDRELRILSMQPTVDDLDVAVRKACSELQGRSLVMPDQAHNPFSPLALGLGTVVRQLARQRGRR